MALSFPANPTNGQIYDQYVYDATAQSWRVYGSDTGITNVLATKANLSGGNTFGGTQNFNSHITTTNSNSTYSSPDPSNTNVPVVTAFNTSNSSSVANAILVSRVGGANGGDPFVSFDIAGVAGWSMGVDNSDGDSFKIGRSWADVGSGSSMVVDTSGRTTLPTQPSFQGQGSGNQINTNNVQLVFDNQGIPGAHNIGNHYNTSTGVFTAPIAGRYQVSFYMLTNPPNMGNASVQIMLRYNGTDRYFVAHSHLGSWVVEGMTLILNMAANDNISFYQYRGSGHYGAYSSLSIRLVG